MTQKKDNKGFSLVELIVVVAIMAVLMGILVPTLVRNVEKSKKQKDLSGIEEIRSTMEKCLADENFSAIDGTVSCTGGKVIISTATATGSNVTDFADYQKEVASQIKDYTCKSKEFKGAEVKFIIRDESVYYEIKSTKSGTTYYSENYRTSAGGSGSGNSGSGNGSST